MSGGTGERPTAAAAEGERIVTLREGVPCPEGFEIARILATGYDLLGPGANYVVTYTVALRPAPAALAGALPSDNKQDG